ncbi:hypothetical protein DV735_g2691, partial [Chaetothyriales sp. CBS 134920]
MEMNYDEQELHKIEDELHTKIYPGTEIMSDVGSHHFVKAGEGSGQVLVPQPSDNPHDPLNWSPFWKASTIFMSTAVSFAMGFGPLSLGPMFPALMEDFDASLADAVQFTGVCILVLGFSNFIWVPIQTAFGRRPVLILATAVCFASCIWRAVAKTYGSFMGACILNGIGAGPSESAQPQIIADVMFLHERGRWNTLYFTFYFGALIRSFWWLNVGLLGLVLVLLIFFFPETKWHRIHPQEVSHSLDTTPAHSQSETAKHDEVEKTTERHEEDATRANQLTTVATSDRDPYLHRGTPSKSQFRLFQPNAHPLQAILLDIWIPIYLHVFPIVEFSAFVVSWSASCYLTINLTQSQAFIAPPYNYSPQTVGLFNLAVLIGVLIGLFINGWLSDWFAARLTRRNRGIREPEMRLPTLIPFVIIMIIGNFVYAFGVQYHWPWPAIVIIGYTCSGIQVAAIPAIATTYAVDSYKPVAGSIMVAITVNKNLWGYGFSKFITNWIAESGWVKPIMMNMCLTVLWCSFGVVYYIWGKRMRGWTKDSKVHNIAAAMPQLERVPRGWKRTANRTTTAAPQVHLQSQTSKGAAHRQAQFTFEVIRPGIFRSQFWSESHPLPPHPSIIAPASTLVPASSQTDTSETLHVDGVQVHTPDRSYVFNGAGSDHYTVHDRSALHVGLGDKAAPLDLSGRFFKLDCTDAFGHDVYRSDPLYKHIPLLIKATAAGCVGVVSTSHSRGSWTVGTEIDPLSGIFKVYRQDYGGLQEYIVVGKTLKDVVRRYAELAGFPLLVPRWAYGYLSGGYKYAIKNEPPAYKVLLDFAAKLREHDIPCSAHQMSSGYSIAETEPRVRNVFHWNSHRFPDPEGWLAEFNSLGLRVFANIKPYLLAAHPEYDYLKTSNALFTDPETGESGVMKLWSAGIGDSGYGGHIDFTSKTGFEWWSRGVENLRRKGVTGAWNDNNEYQLPNDDWEVALDIYQNDPAANGSTNNNKVGLWGRSLHCEIMARASYEGILRAAPNERPFVLSRSATPGTLRYACCSWSGDNVTSWAGMKGANAINLNAGISLMQCFGPDIGGFEGPQPSPELLLRWVQLGIYAPRFAINCFKTSPEDNQAGEVIEPWMYPEITALIRRAIKRRYEILPYIYSLGLESHLFASPSQRWVGWGYESDPEVWTDFLKKGEEQYWFGDSLLVGGAYEPGVDSVKIYLPKKPSDDWGYVNTNAPYEYWASGQWVTVSTPWKESIPVLAKVGGAVPVGKSVQTRMPGEREPACKTLEEDDYRGLEIFPPRGSSQGHVFETTWYDDDGISLDPHISKFTARYSSTEDKIVVGFQAAKDNTFVPPWIDSLTIILLPGETRTVVSETGSSLTLLAPDANGRPRYRLDIQTK